MPRSGPHQHKIVAVKKDMKDRVAQAKHERITEKFAKMKRLKDELAAKESKGNLNS